MADLTRRSFFARLSSALALLVVPIGAVLLPAARKYGRLDVDTALALGYLPAKVYLDGVEIEQSFVVNDVEGWVDCYRAGPDGSLILNASLDGIEQERRYGHVRFVPNPNGMPGHWSSSQH